MKMLFERLEKVIRYTFKRIGGQVTPFMNKLSIMYANAKNGRVTIAK